MMAQVTPIHNPTLIATLLVSQGEKLSETSEKAVIVFKENQAQQQKTIEALTKANTDLIAELLKKETELEQLKTAAAAEKKSFEVKECTKEARLAQFIEIAEKQLGPILTHFLERQTVSFDPRYHSPSDLPHEQRRVENYNARMEVLMTHGTMLKNQIDLLKQNANSH